MARILILLGGTIHTAAAGFHVALPWLANWREVVAALPLDHQGDLYVFNASVTCTLLVFAVLSFGFSSDLRSTAIGRATSLAIAGFWFARALVEVVLEPAPSMLLLAFCVATALLYTVVSVRRSPEPVRSTP